MVSYIHVYFVEVFFGQDSVHFSTKSLNWEPIRHHPPRASSDAA